MGKNFYNTIEASGQQLIEFEDKAAKQTDLVLNIFIANKHRDLTPFEVLAYMEMQGHKCPITSVRRAITQLTDIKELIKHGKDKQKIGLYGAPNYTWQYNLNRA